MKFDFQTFTNLMKMSPAKALEYRDNCHNYKEPTENEAKVTKNDENTEYNPDDFTEDDEIWDISNETENNDVVVVEEEKTVEKEVEIVEKVEETQNVEFTREDLIKKLTEAGVKVHPATKDNTLLKKAIENNLI